MHQILLGLAAVLFLQGTAPTQVSGFKVSGTVVREDNQDPTRARNGDRIVLSGNGPATTIDIGTGGAFEFSDVRPGTYQIVVTPMVVMEPITVVVSDKDVSGLRVVVPNVVPVAGRVTVEGGGPLPRFQMTFTRIDAPPSANAPINVSVGGGRFTAPLPPGQYQVTSSGLPNGYSLKSVTSDTADLLTQPLKVAAGDSDPIAVTLGVSSPPPWVQVRGRITGDVPITTPVRVTMSSTGATETLTAVADSNGSFEFSKVLPGSYSAVAVSATSISTPVTLSVGATDVTNFAIRMPAPKEVNGRIVVQSNASLPIPRVGFFIAPIAGIPASGANLPVNLQPDGAFKIALPVGERQLAIVTGTIPPGYKLTSFMYGTTDLLKNQLRVALTDDAELRVTFDANATVPVSVSGRVTGLLTTKGVRVVLTNLFFGSVETALNSDGSFAFSKVIPGNYNARLSLSGLSASTTVNVGSQDVTNVLITYPREFIVTGHIIVEGGVTGASPPVILEADDAKTGTIRLSNVANKGVIMLSVKDGEHNISVRSVPSGYRIKSIMYGTTDLQKTSLKIDGPPPWEIIVRLVPQ